MPTLATQMNELVTFADSMIEELNDHAEFQGDLHWTVCQDTAEHFDLWDGHNRFPLWLSHIIGGMIREKGIET